MSFSPEMFNRSGQEDKNHLTETRFALSSVKSDFVNITLRSPMKLPFGLITARPSGIFTCQGYINGQDFTGFGEGATLPQPLFTDDCGNNIANSANLIASELLGKKTNLATAHQIIQRYTFKDNGRYPTARMMVEMALIDMVAKATNQSVSDFLGVPKNIKEVVFGKSIGGGDVASTIIDAETAIKNGAKKIKLKVSPATTEVVLEVVQTLRNQYADLELMVDANGTFDPTNDENLNLLEKIDKIGLLMIEEPVSRVGRLRGYDAAFFLRQKMSLSTPICLDDCLTDYETTMEALRTNTADIINIKPGRIGSIITSIEIAQYCQKIGKKVMVGGMFEATPGRTMTTVLAALFHSYGFDIPGDLSLAQERLSTDLVSPEKQLQLGPSGGILLPRNIGWGY